MHYIAVNEESILSPNSTEAIYARLRRRSAEFRREIAGRRTVEKLQALGERQSDPELNLANERSFVRWAHISLYLLAIGGILLRKPSVVFRITAVGLLLYSCVLVIRSTFRYRLRIKVLRKSEEQAKVDDAFLEDWGPQIYGVIVITVLVLLGFTAMVSTWPDILNYIFPDGKS